MSECPSCGAVYGFRVKDGVYHCDRCGFDRGRYDAVAEPVQFIITDTAGVEILVSFWGGLTELPEAAPRTDRTRWGAPLPVRSVAS